MEVSLSELQELVMDREAWRAVIHGVAKSRTWLRDWTEDLILPRFSQDFFADQTKVCLENQKKLTEKLLEQRE